jgi:hypothetical protein
VADFFAARDRFMPTLLWPSIPPPFSNDYGEVKVSK